MYGDKAIDLLREMKRTRTLPPYNEEIVRQVIQETKSLYDSVVDILGTEGVDPSLPSVACGMIVQHTSIQWNKRCLLAYLQARLQRIQSLRWEVGSVLLNEFKSNVSHQEREYFRGYNVMLNKYQKSVDMDLTSDTTPPKDLYIEVRCLKDYGEFLTEDGSVNLQYNCQYYLPRAAIEHLVRHGVLAHIK